MHLGRIKFLETLSPSPIGELVGQQSLQCRFQHCVDLRILPLQRVIQQSEETDDRLSLIIVEAGPVLCLLSDRTLGTIRKLGSIFFAEQNVVLPASAMQLSFL